MTSDPVQVTAVVVLAAGEGKRMHSSVAKVLHEISGRSLLSYAVDAAAAVRPDRLVVVIGHSREQVEAHLSDIAPTALPAVQERPNGTGGAMVAALAALGDVSGEIVVTYGDVPMLTGATLRDLVAVHRDDGNAVTVLTAVVDDPTGYGRIVRQGDAVVKIVEDRDTDAEQARIHEINAGIYVFDADLMRAGLEGLTPNNDQGELYLTDVVSFAVEHGARVGGHIVQDTWQTEGVNDRVQLSAMAREMNRRIVERHMRAGVTVIDPASTWIEQGVTIEQDVTIWPNTYLCGATSIASGAVIGPDTRLRDCEIGAAAAVLRSEATLAVIGRGATVGPFSYLRPGTELGEAGKIGAFVETKSARIGAGAKVPHLTYCGDAEIGEGANIGAGTIFANYDSVAKRRSTVGRHAFIGSDSVLVAPVHIADGAFVAAGSTITGDVAAGDLGVARGRQVNIPGWVASKRAGTKSAEAAEAALAHPNTASGKE